MDPRVGSHLGRYQIKAVIGRGAMGVVYRAKDPKINRAVALKTVSVRGLEPDEERKYRKRFVVEAQAAGRLSHTGIVTIFDVAEDAETGTPYLVMEYVKGKSLDHILRGENGRLPLNTALQLTQELAEALHYAHAQGVVHRDIKPSNILVTSDGHAKIADFGIAKLNQTNLTLHGQVLGSPAYMAPEQLADAGVDARSDLFSLGVVLYYMLTGQRPFQGNSVATVCFKLTNHEPLAVGTYDMSFPPELDLIVSRAIAKNPAQRYQSGGEMARDIQRLRDGWGSGQTADPEQDASFQRTGEPKPDASILPSSEATARQPSDTSIRGTRPSLLLVRSLILTLVIGAAAVVSVVSSRTYETEAPPPPPSPKTPVLDQALERSAPDHPPDAELHLEIENPFPEARASVWLDNHLVYTQALHANPRNHLLIFRQTEDQESHKVEVQSGKHLLKVRVHSKATAYDQSRTLAVNFAPKSARTLRVSCDKKHSLLQVVWQ